MTLMYMHYVHALIRFCTFWTRDFPQGSPCSHFCELWETADLGISAGVACVEVDVTVYRQAQLWQAQEFYCGRVTVCPFSGWRHINSSVLTFWADMEDARFEVDQSK